MPKDNNGNTEDRENIIEAETVSTLTLGYSSCPNDTFIFYALVHGKVIPRGIALREILADVETLNLMAQRAELDVSKVSYHAFGLLREKYCLLRSGGALGKGCGPLIVAQEEFTMNDLKERTIAIPGRLTTAFLLLQIFDSSFGRNVRVMPFDKIIGSVCNGEVDAGLIIHESRFTYQKAGLKQIIDLGDWWERETGLPVPLGGIIAKRDLGEKVIRSIEKLISQSIEYAFAHRDETRSYVREHAQEIDDVTIEKHIDLYVTGYSLDIGEDGTRAVHELFKRAENKGIFEKSTKPLFSAS
jgi:1,4-dihydroxy-6-naphthoate synthase